MSDELLNLITVPLFTGAIGYTTNWSGVWMLFNPVHFRGTRVPGLKALVPLLPRKIQQIPGVMHGGIGWQGIDVDDAVGVPRDSRNLATDERVGPFSELT